MSPEKTTGIEFQDALRSEFKRLSTLALEYRVKARDAKTSIKKELYNKKLSKVNKKVYNILAQMQIFSTAQANQQPKLDIKVNDNEDV